MQKKILQKVWSCAKPNQTPILKIKGVLANDQTFYKIFPAPFPSLKVQEFVLNLQYDTAKLGRLKGRLQKLLSRIKRSPMELMQLGLSSSGSERWQRALTWLSSMSCSRTSLTCSWSPLPSLMMKSCWKDWSNTHE